MTTQKCEALKDSRTHMSMSFGSESSADLNHMVPADSVRNNCTLVIANSEK